MKYNYIVKMKRKFVDCFMLMGTALSIRGGQKLPEMGRPVLYDAFTTFVNISLTVQEIKIFDSSSLEMELGILLDQKWIDPRLGANFKTRKMAVAGQIWKPKILNLNGNNKMCHDEDTVFWRGFGEEGNVLLSEKINLNAPCTWNYRSFPFDTQICELKFGSYRFPMEEVTILWDTNPVEITANLNHNDFEITSITTRLENEMRRSGNFSEAVVQFELRRHSSRHVQCIMLPSFLLTLLNYVTFWFDLNRRSMRLFLNVAIFSCMLYFYYVSVCLLNPAPYLKALDIFIIISEVFSLIVLLETIFIDSMCTSGEIQFHLKKTACGKEYRKSVYWSELAMKLAYPVFYIFSLILYVFVYFD